MELHSTKHIQTYLNTHVYWNIYTENAISWKSSLTYSNYHAS